MNQVLIEKYINKLTIKDIKEYAKKQNILLTNNEDEIIYDFIKKNYKDLINNEYNEDFLRELKCKLSFDTYEKIKNLYKEAKEKIK